jgi:glycosyltransferase involved in cell wall biosynthesis
MSRRGVTSDLATRSHSALPGALIEGGTGGRPGPEPIRVHHLVKSLGRGVADRERFAYGYGYFLPWKDAVVPALRAQGAEVTCFGARSSAAVLAAARRVARHLRTREVDVVHAHLPVAGVVARLAGRLAGVPVVYTEHNLQERYHPATRWLNLRTWGWQAEAVAVSSDVADSIRRHAGDRVPVCTVLNGVNVRAYDPARYDGAAVRARWGIPPDAPVVGTVAVFRPQKRLDHWLQVARRVADAVPGTHFLLVGDGPERAALEAQAAALGLEEAVHFTGLQEETRPCFAAMDVYLMTSRFEGLPVALLEGMAMAVPPVVTAVGGIPEVVRFGENGSYQPYGSVQALAGDVAALLRDPERRCRLGRAARATVVERFSLERMQRALEAIYERVIAEHRARR